MPDFTSIIDFFNRRRQKQLLGDADDRDLFVKKYKAFRRLLKSNNEVLLTIADMQEKASGGFLFDRVYVQSAYDTISAGIIRIIDNLNIVADSKYADLIIPYQKIDAQIRTELTKGVTIPVSNYVLPLKELNQNRIAEAGGKFAYLGELMNSLDAPVPPGFVITTYAYQSFARQNHVEDFMLQKADDFHSRDYAKVEHACREVQTLVINGEVKTELSEAIVEACEALQKEVGHEDLRLALRSSALHEDVRASFAGQLRSVLNVPPASIFEEYKAILASQFTPRAILYYLDQGFAVEEMAMAVGALAMVDAKVSGIVYSKDPRCPNEDIVLVSAVWGLGSYAVEGKVLTTNYCIFGDKGDQIECEEDARQEVMLVPDPSTGTKEMHVPAECFDTPCLNDEQVHRLVAFARRAEKHLGKPQDMEWAFDQSDQLYLLQSRPLRLSIQKPPSDRKRPRQVEGQKILIEKGTIACPGTAQGRVCVMTDLANLSEFPQNGVLVIRHTDPELAEVLPCASAVVADVGTLLGHLATVAREYNVPAIFNTGNATRILQDGMHVTVDADYGNVYEGVVEELLSERMSEDVFDRSPIISLLRKILEMIVPLNLTDPRSVDFSARTCKTYHDITRFAHETALRSIFSMSKESYFRRSSAKQMVSDVPLQWWVIDLEDGISSEVKGKKVKPEEIVSLPMTALWAGMIAVPWKGPPPVDSKGFMSVMLSSMTDPGIEPAVGRKFVDRNYIIVARNFCNVSTRLGFHFSTVEAYLGDDENLNYISFIYTGGGADHGRKNRRAGLISRLLQKYDFRVERKEDTVFGRIEGHQQAFIEDRLKVLGYLIVHTRQMDMVMYNDSMVDYYYAEMTEGIDSFMIPDTK